MAEARGSQITNCGSVLSDFPIAHVPLLLTWPARTRLRNLRESFNVRKDPIERHGWHVRQPTVAFGLCDQRLGDKSGSQGHHLWIFIQVYNAFHFVGKSHWLFIRHEF